MRNCADPAQLLSTGLSENDPIVYDIIEKVSLPAQICPPR